MEQFEWDEKKARSNQEKHGVDFEDAIDIFEDTWVARKDTRVDYGEDRMIALGEVDGHVLVVVYTMRGGTCRLISARKANRDERYAYRKAVAERSPEG